MTNIPTEVSLWFSKQGVLDYKLLEYNPRKGRWCFSFTDKNKQELFLKWNDNSKDYTLYYQSMKQEERIYICLSTTEIAPKYIGGGAFVTAYISNPKTLRSTIKDLNERKEYNKIYEIVILVLNKWQKFVECDLDFLTICEPMTEYQRYLYSVLLACPMGARMDEKEKHRNKYAFFILSRVLKPLIYRYINKPTTVYRNIHGDFHLNNIICERNESFYLVDFEDAKVCLPELELAYFMSQIHALLKNEKELRERIDRYVENNVDVLSNKSLYYIVLRTFDYTIKFNHAFN